MNIVIVNYGSGNLRSAAKAFERATIDMGSSTKVLVTGDPEIVLKADRIVLPGVGAFASCLRGLCAKVGLMEALQESVTERGAPFFGICVGMQLMASTSYEHGSHDGFGWIPGEVSSIKNLSNILKIPHMGWNELSNFNSSHPVLKNFPSNPHFYFVHSYSYHPRSTRDLLATAHYGEPVTAIIGRGNMIGTQFHPEKSQANGLRLIRNFLEWRP